MNFYVENNYNVDYKIMNLYQSKILNYTHNEYLISDKLNLIYYNYFLNLHYFDLYKCDSKKRKIFIKKLINLRNNYISKKGKLFTLEEINKELE